MSNSDASMKIGKYEVGDRCDIKQYELLKHCSKIGDISEWNDWRKDNPDEEIWLVGARLVGANLRGAILVKANLQGAILVKANLQGAILIEAKLRGTQLSLSSLQNAELFGANLQGAELLLSKLQDAELRGAKLQSASFNYAIVDGETMIASCMIDEDTDFTGVGLDAARVELGLKQLLEYNIRRKRWEEWYKKDYWLTRILKKIFIRPFWWMSDYGRSTGRIIFTFVFLSMLFAAIYGVCGLIWYPGIVANLFEDSQGPIPGWLVPFRAGYFSIVTMTTLGFGDMHADARNLAGHVLLMLQVILGYVLLGALITRFAILFTSGGPAGKFTKKTP